MDDDQNSNRNGDREALARLRADIDAIDRELAALLARRFAKTDGVGLLKARLGEAPVDPGRQAERREVLGEAARQHGLPEPMWRDLQRRISAEVVQRHQCAADAARGGNSEHHEP